MCLDDPTFDFLGRKAITKIEHRIESLLLLDEILKLQRAPVHILPGTRMLMGRVLRSWAAARIANSFPKESLQNGLWFVVLIIVVQTVERFESKYLQGLAEFMADAYNWTRDHCDAIHDPSASPTSAIFDLSADDQVESYGNGMGVVSDETRLTIRFHPLFEEHRDTVDFHESMNEDPWV
ncbi:hypothetical protein F4778DRAFT_314268 [Xylariomycetidae sp. FL2044]|nr:hypothetical protein F4778DRAFT_314268 [Xylariomycetidae sp. FL2044]